MTLLDASQPSRIPHPAAMLGRVVLLVHDYDEALEFYRAALGAEPLFDQVVAAGQRYVHVGLPAQAAASAERDHPPVGLWFLQATGAERDLVGRQAGAHPFLVLYTSDCAASLERFTRAGGRLRREMHEEAGARFAHVADLYGTEIVLVEMLAWSGSNVP